MEEKKRYKQKKPATVTYVKVGKKKYPSHDLISGEMLYNKMCKEHPDENVSLTCRGLVYLERKKK